jgi:hypothetical protein
MKRFNVEGNELALPEGDEIRNLSGEDLDAFELGAVTEIETMFQGDNVTSDHVTRGRHLETELGRVATERSRRAAELQQNIEERDAILSRVKASTVSTDKTAAATPPAAAETPVAAAVETPAKPQGGVTAALRELGGLDGAKRNLNPTLRGKNRTMTTSQVDLGRAQSFSKISEAPQRGLSVLATMSDVPGHPQGAQIPTMSALTKAMMAKAKTLAVSHDGVGHRVPVAQLQRKFTYNVDSLMDSDMMSAVIESAVDPEILVAAGGWCAPHEISYDFYNIVCSDGTWDAPTIGINRGGLQWPVSPSYADIAALAGVAWTWTNTQDIAAVTGTAQSGTKPCVRVPCPSYNDATLACDGMCVTVGNLTQDAFPELIQNHLRLVEAIHYHYVNTRRIAAMVAGSTSVTGAGSDVSSSWGLLNSTVFERRDLIEKYQMCDDAVMEAVFPRFAKDKIKSDFAMRTGISDWQCVTDAMLADWFDCRNIRTQWVSDWQVRGTGQPGASSAPTNWAVNTQYAIYPAGTWAIGQGMTLDLGVVRDSVLNATNDHTAAWMEECWLLAKIGHESRVVTVDDCVNGISGAASASGCNV